MPAITFDQARQVVLAHLFAVWQPELGTPYAASSGFQDDTHWRVVAGAREALVDGDDAFQLMDAPAFLVDKDTGELILLNVITHLDELDAMRSVP